MIVTVLACIGVGSALWSWRRVKRLAQLPIRRIWLVWTALLTQLIVFQWVARHIPETATEIVHIATYVLIVAFIASNLRLPGAWAIGLGTLGNFVAIVANGGSMPADMDAWRRAGLRPIPDDAFKNSSALSNPRLGYLGDIFAIPAGWPFANVFSIGDVVIVLGGTYLAHRWCSAAAEESVPTERLELSLTRT